MKKFLARYLLFPKKWGAAPYFWCLFLLYPLINAIQASLWQQLVIIGLVVIFYFSYRAVYIVDGRRLTFWLLVQLVLSIALTFIANDVFIFLFPAFQIGTQRFSKRRFQIWWVVYLLFVFIPLVIGGVVTHQMAQMMGFSHNVTFFYNLIWLAFIVFSPLASYSLSQSALRTRQAEQSNDRIANSIRRGERDRIARDLHDTLGQSFSMITIKTELAEKLLVKAPDKVATELADIEATSRANLQLVRDIVTDLRQPTITETLILQEQNLRTSGIVLLTENESLVLQFSQTAQKVFAQVLQEAITNVIRYSQSRDCQVKFDQTAEQIQMRVIDHGIGLGQARPNSHGIAGMQERLKAVGGALQVKNQNGVTLIASLPFGE